MRDLISRQAAIDALGEEPLVWCDGEDEIAERNQWKRDIEAIKQLPPIQSKLLQPWEVLVAQAVLPQPEPCEDAVSRTEILRMINCINDHHAITPYKSVGAVTEHLTRIASSLPPVTSKQHTGHWIPVGVVEVVGGESAMWGSAVAYHKCSECDEQALRDDFEQEVLSKWCPHCGAKMVGVSE